MYMKSILLSVLMLETISSHQIKLTNNCPFTVWPGLLGNSGKSTPENGGLSLAQGAVHDFQVPNGWGGRIWGRTECDGNGHCVTGDCGNKIACNGAGGVPPVTLAEFTFDGWGGKDYYDISLVDGYNLPMQIRPIPGTFRKTGNGKYDCNTAGCYADLNARCPAELAVKSRGRTVACKSACMKFNTDQYCCRGAHNKPKTCKSSDWPKNYPAIFKKACPDAYSYAYDDTTSTFTCRGNPSTGYEIVYCP